MPAARLQSKSATGAGRSRRNETAGTLQLKARRKARTSRVLIALFGTIVAVSPAAADDEAINFAFFYPIASNHNDPDGTATVRLGLVYGRLGGVSAFDLCGVVARTDGDVRGLQIAGITSYTTGAFRGVGLTAGVNVLQGAGSGLQAAALANFDRGTFDGAQMAGLFNFAGSDLRGLQFASVYNLCDASIRGVQLAGVANILAGGFVGGQLSAINLAGGKSRGFQAGYCNSAFEIDGAQIGLVNLAGAAHGTQIGIVNRAKKMDGVPVGAVNLAGNGSRGWAAYASTLVGFSAGMRTVVNGWTSMATIGIGDWHGEQGTTGSIAWHYGHRIADAAGWDFGADVGWVHLIPYKDDDPAVNDRLHYAVQPRITAERPMGRWRLLAGAGLSVIASEYSTDATTDVEPLGLVGLIYE